MDHPVAVRDTFLMRWPQRAQRWFTKRTDIDPADQVHVLRWFTKACERRQAAHPERLPERTFASHVIHLIAVTSSWHAASQVEGRSMADLLPLHATESDMVHMVAKATLCWMKGRERTRGSTLDPRTIQSFIKAWYDNLRCGVQCMVFPRASGLTKAMCSVREILRRIQSLAADPASPWTGLVEGAAAVEIRTDASAFRTWKTKDPIQRWEVDRLLRRGCRDPADRVLVLLLSTAAPRVHAITGIHRDHVLLGEEGRVRTEFPVLEKGSKVRMIHPTAELRDALRDLLRRSKRAFVFSEKGTQPPSSRSILGSLHNICRRARVRPLNPHLFRAFVVNQGVRRGVTTERMAKFLGHTDVYTTARHYLSDDMATVVQGVWDQAMVDPTEPPPIVTDNEDELRAQLMAAEAELQRLEMAVAAMDQQPPPPPDNPRPQVTAQDPTEGDLDVDALLSSLV